MLSENDMRHRFLLIFAVCCSRLLLSGSLLGQGSQPEDTLLERARQEFQNQKYGAAERDFGEVTRRDPSNIYAQVFLGQSLFNQQKYADAISPYEKARDLENSGKVLSLEQKRILTDQLAMAYGMSGQLRRRACYSRKPLVRTPSTR
jgi:predicted Zn-dependent protease